MIIMSRKKNGRQPYVAPQCKAIQTENESFICAVSVRPNTSSSTMQPGYDDKGEHNVGTVFFGDPSSVAPAKQGGFWDYNKGDEY